MMIKVCLLVNDIKLGAVTYLLGDLFQSYDRNLFQFVIVNLSSNKDSGCSILRKIGIRILSLDVGDKIFIRQAIQVYKILSQIRPDIVHSHMGRSIILGLTVSKLAGVKKIICTHHTVLKGYHRMTRLGIIIFGRYSDRFIYVSPTVAESFNTRKLFRLKGQIIFNCIDYNRIKQSIINSNPLSFRQSIGISANTLLIATIGRLIPAKNHQFVLEVVKYLKQYDEDFVWLIVGDGPLLKVIRRMVQINNLNGWVKLLGFRTDILQLINAADIIVNPSIWEGLSITMLETMVLGKVFIGSSIKQYTDYISHGINGFVLSLEKPQEFASLIYYLKLNKALREQIGISAQKTFMEKFSIVKTRKTYFSLYKELRYGKTEI